MAKGVTLILKKGGKKFDISELVEKVKWSGRKGAAARSLQVSLLDDDGYGHDRSGIKLMSGCQLFFKYNGKELFRGLVMKSSQSNRKMMTVTAYDNGIYLANNRDTFMYSGATADAIFNDICTRYKLKVGSVAPCGYGIPELTKPRTTAWDVICDALAQDYAATGIRHYVMSNKGKLSLIERRVNKVQWVIESGANLSSYTYEKSIEDIKTRVLVRSKEGDTLAFKNNGKLEKKIGIFQEIETKSDPLEGAQAGDIIENILKAQGKPEKSLDVEAIGKPAVISGKAVYVIIPHLNLKRTFYVDSDTHSFDDRSHMMDLKLNYYNED